MVIDLLGLASRYATRAEVEAWTNEEPPFPDPMPMPPHVLGIDPSQRPGGPWTTRLQYPDGREEFVERMPGEIT